jgi:hydroxymethylpyrimidine pyrophosphatase-like HAD family hydrolase
MRFRALACDYDGTLATSGRITPATREALERWRSSGRKLLLVTGRELNDLTRVCSELTLFDAVIVENGAMLHLPQAGESRLLCEPIAGELMLALRDRGIVPLGIARAILATSRAQAAAVVQVAQELGLEVSLAYNKASVMVLPAGVDKGSGLAAALAALGLTSAQTIGIGDAENDMAFMRLCGLGVAVANAVPEVCGVAQRVTKRPEGEGVGEIVAEVLGSDV